MLDEVVPATADEIRLVQRVRAIGRDNQIERFVGLDQFVHQLNGHGRVHVVVHVTVHQQEMPPQVRRIRLVRRRGKIVIAAPHRIAGQQPLVFLRPVDVVAAIVMIAGTRHRNLEELGELEDGIGAGETTARMSKNAHAVQIDEPVARAQLFDRRNVIGQPVVGEVAIVIVVERLRAAWRPQMIDLYDHETQFGQRKGLTTVLERPRAHRSNLRTGIDVRDDRIAFGAVDFGRQVHHTVNVRQSVARFGGEWNRRLPSQCRQLRHVRLLQRAHHAPRERIAQHRDRRRANRAVLVHHELAARTHRQFVIGCLGCQPRESGTVQAHFVQVRVVHQLVVLTPTTAEPHRARGFVHVHHGAHLPRTTGDLVFHAPIVVEQPQMTIAITL